MESFYEDITLKTLPALYQVYLWQEGSGRDPCAIGFSLQIIEKVIGHQRIALIPVPAADLIFVGPTQDKGVTFKPLDRIHIGKPGRTDIMKEQAPG